jgi:hypothetical protein
VAHAAKASARGLVNTSPEPVSNVVVSTGEDLASAGLLWLAFEYPLVAGGIAAVLLAAMIALVLAARRVLRRVFRQS